MHQKVCKGCKTQADAYVFVSALSPLFTERKITIAEEFEEGILVVDAFTNIISL